MSIRSDEVCEAIVAAAVDSFDGYTLDSWWSAPQQIHVMMLRYRGCTDSKRAHHRRDEGCDCIGPVTGVDTEQCFRLLAALIDQPDVHPDLGARIRHTCENGDVLVITGTKSWTLTDPDHLPLPGTGRR